jgi:hypothetical protein
MQLGTGILDTPTPFVAFPVDGHGKDRVRTGGRVVHQRGTNGPRQRALGKQGP